MFDEQERDPFWTAADEAECVAMVRGFVAESYEHLDAGGCPECAAGVHCEALEEGARLLVRWYERQTAVGAARFLRVHQNERDRVELEAAADARTLELVGLA